MISYEMFLGYFSFRAKAGDGHISWWSPFPVTGLEEVDLLESPGSWQRSQFRPPSFVGQRLYLFLGLADVPGAAHGFSVHMALTSF